MAVDLYGSDSAVGQRLFINRIPFEVVGVLTICLALLAGAYLTINRNTDILGIKMSNEPISLSALLLFYGFLAAWVILVAYVVSLAARERNLRKELTRVRGLIEERERAR